MPFFHYICTAMKTTDIILVALLTAASAFFSGNASAQNNGNRRWSGYMEYIVEGKDTIFIDEIRASRIFPKLARQKGKDWRKYYRLVYNFSKTYPYAIVSRTLVAQADSTIEADGLTGAKREKYLLGVQKELFHVFEKPLKNLTVSQGALLMKLIDREVGKSSYNIIREYRNGMAAGFWQGIAKMFGSDLKKGYDPEGEDKATEDLVEKWWAGDFDNFYYSLFWEYPRKVNIPEEYLRAGEF